MSEKKCKETQHTCGGPFCANDEVLEQMARDNIDLQAEVERLKCVNEDLRLHLIDGEALQERVKELEANIVDMEANGASFTAQYYKDVDRLIAENAALLAQVERMQAVVEAANKLIANVKVINDEKLFSTIHGFSAYIGLLWQRVDELAALSSPPKPAPAIDRDDCAECVNGHTCIDHKPKEAKS